MVIVERSALLEFRADNMFAMVQDVEAYPQFLPWCSRAEVNANADGVVMATLHVNYRGIRHQFTTRNVSEPGRLITIQLVSGPFRHLTGFWRFIPLEDKVCKIEFRLEYQLANGILDRALGPVFHHISDSFVDAFVRRAEQIHGTP